MPTSSILQRILWILYGWTVEKLNTCSFHETYEYHRNSPHSTVDCVCVNVTSDESGLNLYQLPQEEVDSIKRMLKGRNDSDIESDDESVGNDTALEGEYDVEHPRHVSCNTRSRHPTTLLSLI